MLDTANGPLVEYGMDDDAVAVEDEIPDGWSVSWETPAVKLTSGRYRSPLVRGTTTVHIAISNGTPSDYYRDDEQAQNGALDYDVTLSFGDKVVEGGITLYRDHDGSMGTCGTPRDGWVSSEILHGIGDLDAADVREILSTLSACAATGQHEAEIEVRS